MYRFAFVAILTLWTLSSPALAKTFPIPSDNPVATINIPNSWEPSEYDGGVEGTSKDGQFYFAIEAVNSKDIGEATNCLLYTSDAADE